MKKLSYIGIKTSVFFGPIYPTINPKEIEKIIDTFSINGSKEIMIDKFNLKPGIFDNLTSILKKHPEVSFKNLKDTEHYNKIRNQIITLKENKEVRIRDAF